MLDEEFITELIGIGEFQVIGGEIKEAEAIIEVEQIWETALCPRCSEPSCSVLEYIGRQTRDLSISGKRVYLKYRQRRFRCWRCEKSFLEEFESIKSPAAHYTARYEEWVAEQVSGSTVEKVARQEKLSWETIQYMIERVAKRRGVLEKPRAVRYLAIDEIALRKGHKQYALIISAPEQGRILAVLEGRTKEELSRYLKEIWGKRELQKVEVVTMDMWDGYFYAVLENLPNAVIVIDRFHVQKNLLDAISKFRRQIQRKLSEEKRKELKGIRWLLVSNYDELPDDKKQTLDQALDRCPELALCHYVKEEFRDWYEQDHDVKSAAKALDKWIAMAASLGSRALNNFINTLKNWKDSILNYFDEFLSNGFAEGLNNKLQLLKRKAFGFRNFSNFRLRALLLHEFPR